jgi:hypothetical protein
MDGLEDVAFFVGLLGLAKEVVAEVELHFIARNLEALEGKEHVLPAAKPGFYLYLEPFGLFAFGVFLLLFEVDFHCGLISEVLDVNSVIDGLFIERDLFFQIEIVKGFLEVTIDHELASLSSA